ncbi:MAG: hypothetical protein QXJ19_04130 [Candidatus Bathyarchaeia archaeon]|nr:hypothetical protein [Candidatus Bathyarchaeota archaeon]
MRTSEICIEKNGITLRFNPETGKLSCKVGEKTLFKNGVLAYVDGDGALIKVTSNLFKHHISRKTLNTVWGETEALQITSIPKQQLPSLKWLVYSIPNKNGLVFEAELINTTGSDIYIREIHPLSLRAEDGGVLLEYSGNIFYGSPYWKTGREPEELSNVRLRNLRESWSRCWWTMVMASRRDGGRGLVTGVLERANIEISVLVRRSCAPSNLGLEMVISGGCYIDPIWDHRIWSDEFPFLDRRPLRVKSGVSFKTSATTLMWDEDIFRCLDQYAETIKEFNNIQLPSKPISGVFLPYSLDKENNSYTYLNREEYVIEWMDFLDKTELGKYGLRYFWQDFSSHGSPNLFIPYQMNTFPIWVENSRGYRVEKYFSKGIKALVDMMHKRGYKAGISTRPFTYVKAGEPDEDKKTEEIYRKIADWGIDYVILDFHYDFKENLSWDHTCMEIFKRRYLAIRKAVGKNVFIEACGVPLGPIIGLADAFRTSRDWRPHLSHRVLSGLKALYYLHGKCFWNHPEFFDVSEIPFSPVDQPRIKYSLERTRSWISLLGILCLNMFAGGYLPKFATPERLNLYKKVLPVYPGRATPIDLFEREYPRVYDLPIKKSFGEWHVIGLFNWEEKPDTIDLDFRRLGFREKVLAFDFWEEKFLEVNSGKISFKIAPFDCKIISAHEDSTFPKIIGTNRHITQGGIEIKDEKWIAYENTLEVSSISPEETNHDVFIYLPANFAPKETFNARIIEYVPPILRVNVSFGKEEEVRWKILFKKQKNLE